MRSLVYGVNFVNFNHTKVMRYILRLSHLTEFTRGLNSKNLLQIGMDDNSADIE